MEYIWTRIVTLLTVFMKHTAAALTDSQSNNTFTSWKQPLINSGNGVGNCTVVLLDGTSDPNITLEAVGGTGRVIYSILDQNPSGFFRLSGSNLDQLKTYQSLDLELNRNYFWELIIRAEDESTPVHKTGTVTMTIFFSDVNDWPPSFSHKFYKATIPENEPIGTSVVLVNAFDGDLTSPNRDVTYVLTGGNANGDFTLSSRSGRIAVAKPLSVNRTARYFLDVIAVDGGVPQLTGSTTVVINVYEADPGCTTQKNTEENCNSGTTQKSTGDKCTCGTGSLTNQAAVNSKSAIVTSATFFVIFLFWN